MGAGRVNATDAIRRYARRIQRSRLPDPERRWPDRRKLLLVTTGHDLLAAMFDVQADIVRCNTPAEAVGHAAGLPDDGYLVAVGPDAATGRDPGTPLPFPVVLLHTGLEQVDWLGTMDLAPVYAWQLPAEVDKLHTALIGGVAAL